MVDPIAKAGAGKVLDVVGGQDKTTPAKTGESKFDRVRADVQDRDAQRVEIPPEVKQVSMQKQKAMEKDMTTRLQKGASPRQILDVNMKNAKVNVDQLTKRINALPKTPAFQPFRDRLASIDTQFQDAGKLMNSIKGGESPQQLLKIQMSMYQLTENVELMSKVVDQVTSGMKNILQTQV
jgi:hypothetical protein